MLLVINQINIYSSQKINSINHLYIYIYIYKQRPHVGKYEILLSDAFYAKRIEIFSSAISKIRTN